jgi:murein DD-endopeptidase MepM/ murein hydrolase activator NlpD
VTWNRKRSESSTAATGSRIAGALLSVVLTWSIAPIRAARAAPGAPLPALVYPILGSKLSSHFGKRVHPRLRYLRHHDGIDLAAPSGAQIRAMAPGMVIYADKHFGYGNFVVIKHDGELTTHYGHCEKIFVRPGEVVPAGAVIGTVGETGVATGPHLHLEVRRSGQPQEPLKILPGLMRR